MNGIWLAIVLTCSAIITVISPESLLPAMIGGGESALSLCLKLLPIYVVWCGILEIMDESELSGRIAACIKPLSRRLLKGESEETLSVVGMNFAANFLGMGGVATPMGIKAISLMDDNSGVATRNMQLFTVINTTSVQLIPTTVIALRATAGSATPSDIILPSIIVSVVTTVVGVLLVLIFGKK